MVKMPQYVDLIVGLDNQLSKMALDNSQEELERHIFVFDIKKDEKESSEPFENRARRETKIMYLQAFA